MPVQSSPNLEGIADSSLDFETLCFTALCLGVLLFMHWATPRIRRLSIFDNATLNSIIDGLVIGYVFLQILPGLMLEVEGLKEQAESNFLKNEMNLVMTIFLFMLAGFLTLYAAEKNAHEKTRFGRESSQIIYMTHIGTVTFVNFIIALMIPSIASVSLPLLCTFTIVMGLHFIVQDHSLNHHFPNRFNEWGRYVLMIGMVAGWLVGVFLLPHAKIIPVAFLNAFLAGSLVLSVTRTEFSSFEGHSRFAAFIASLSVESAVIFIALLLENIG